MSRDYLHRNGSLVAVEIDQSASIEAVESELHRLYGAGLRLEHWRRHGPRRWRAVVRKDEQFRNYPRNAGDLSWFEVAP